MKEDIIVKKDQSQTAHEKRFSSSNFSMPTESEERILQQAILSGLIENLSRQITVFDQKGNVVERDRRT